MPSGNFSPEYETDHSPGWRARARTVGRTPAEAAALEAALQRRRDRLRAARQDAGTPPPPSRRPQFVSSQPAASAVPQPVQQQRHHFTSTFLDCVREAERARRQRPRRDDGYERLARQYHAGLHGGHQRGMLSVQDMQRREMMELADEWERNNINNNDDDDDDLEYVRSQIRADGQLSGLAKLVLLLTMQIPRGRWTTYRAMQEYISEKRGMCSVRQVGQCLGKRDFPAEEVPVHRVFER